jgi:hypothetical protein
LVIVGFWRFWTYRPIAAPSVGFGVGRLQLAKGFSMQTQSVMRKSLLIDNVPVEASK